MSIDFENLSFDGLPHAVAALRQELSEIKRILIRQAGTQPEDQLNEWMDINQLIQFIPSHPAKHTIYIWIGKGEIPSHKKGKRLFFRRSEIEAWLIKGKRSTADEISQETDAALQSLKIRRG